MNLKTLCLKMQTYIGRHSVWEKQWTLIRVQRDGFTNVPDLPRPGWLPDGALQRTVVKPAAESRRTERQLSEHSVRCGLKRGTSEGKSLNHGEPSITSLLYQLPTKSWHFPRTWYLKFLLLTICIEWREKMSLKVLIISWKYLNATTLQEKKKRSWTWMKIS